MNVDLPLLHTLCQRLINETLDCCKKIGNVIYSSVTHNCISDLDFQDTLNETLNVPEWRVLTMRLYFDGWIKSVCRKLWKLLEVVYTTVRIWILHRQQQNTHKLKDRFVVYTCKYLKIIILLNDEVIIFRIYACLFIK